MLYKLYSKPLSTKNLACFRRYFASTVTASTQKIASLDHDLRVSRMPNGLSIASLEMQKPVSHLCLAFRAGSRYEKPEERGLTHRLRNCYGLGTLNSTAIRLLYHASMLGAEMHCTSTRDLLMFNINVVRDFAPWALEVLGESACQPGFKAWELDDTNEIMQLEVEQLKQQPDLVLLELLHEAAFGRSGLSNSLLSPDFQIGRHKDKMLEAFATSRFFTSEACIVGVNVDHASLLSYATERCPLPGGSGPRAEPAAFRGGCQIRHRSNGPVALVAVVAEGASLQDLKHMAVQSVFGYLIGSGPYIKYNTGLGKATTAVASALGADMPFGLTAISESYSDAGFFGIQMATRGEKVAEALKAALKVVRACQPNDAELRRAKNLAKLNLLTEAENGQTTCEDMASQVLATGAVNKIGEILEMIEAVSVDDVKKMSDQWAQSKWSMAAVGNIDSTPYLDEIR